MMPVVMCGEHNLPLLVEIGSTDLPNSGSAGDATPWARAAKFVKKPPLIVNVTYLELNGFDASMWVS